MAPDLERGNPGYVGRTRPGSFDKRKHANTQPAIAREDGSFAVGRVGPPCLSEGDLCFLVKGRGGGDPRKIARGADTPGAGIGEPGRRDQRRGPHSELRLDEARTCITLKMSPALDLVIRAAKFFGPRGNRLCLKGSAL